ncbi:lactate utilization protein [Oleidesulfovibrio sp.]|uniref:lactate utilization protein n=1 Tax=Oleidesulfovibrio sp. TaxID=2909707 RepID=UPI003A85F882
MKEEFAVAPKADTPAERWWAMRLGEAAESLQANNFDVFVAADCREAGRIFLQEILPATGAKTISFGGSMTLAATGVVEAVREDASLDVIDTFDKSVGAEEALERRRQALLSDVFLAGTNALTECGKLVNLDMIGNRVGAINFGPKHVVLFIGRNKLVEDVAAAMDRIKNYASPTNTMRLDKKTPCKMTSHCTDCSSPDRICNVWTITEKSFPKGRIRVVLINEDCGL